MVHAGSLLKQAQVNATQSEIDGESSRKHARNALLLAENVKLELARLDVLIDFDFVDEEIKSTVEKLRGLRVRMEEAADTAVDGWDEELGWC